MLKDFKIKVENGFIQIQTKNIANHDLDSTHPTLLKN